MAIQFSALKMVIVFALFHAKTSALNPSPTLDSLTLSQVANVAPQVITPGFSLAGTTLQGLAAPGENFTCVIQVENWSRYPLLYPDVRFYSKGYLTTAPTEIMPGKMEAFAVQKSNVSKTGLEGYISWMVGDVKKYFVVAWSIPYYYDSMTENEMTLGMTGPGVTRGRYTSWLSLIRNDGSKAELAFQKSTFGDTNFPIIFSDEQFEMVGTMTNIHRAQVKVVFRPISGNWGDLALPFMTLLKKSYLP